MTSQNRPDFSFNQVERQAGPDLGGLQAQIDELRTYIDSKIANHHHNGNEGQSIQLDTDLRGLFDVVSTAPSGIPQSAYDQIKIYTNSTTYRLYWYDWRNKAWRYASGT